MDISQIMTMLDISFIIAYKFASCVYKSICLYANIIYKNVLVYILIIFRRHMHNIAFYV